MNRHQKFFLGLAVAGVIILALAVALTACGPVPTKSAETPVSPSGYSVRTLSKFDDVRNCTLYGMYSVGNSHATGYIVVCSSGTVAMKGVQ